MATARGSCFCGAVHFTVELPVKWCAHCHCTMCRRLHGAAFVTWFGVARERIRLSQDDCIWYSSSAEAERAHCRHCATQLLFRSSRWPDEIHVALATMLDPIDRAPQLHVYTGDAVNWVELGDHLPRYRSVPSDEAAGV